MNSNLENRVLYYSANILRAAKHIDKSYEGDYLRSQIIRSGCSICLNFAESQGSESRKDYIHKSSIVLKELRETFMCLRLLEISDLVKVTDLFEKLLKESNELISIFVSCIKTAKSNLKN